MLGQMTLSQNVLQVTSSDNKQVDVGYHYRDMWYIPINYQTQGGHTGRVWLNKTTGE